MRETPRALMRGVWIRQKPAKHAKRRDGKSNMKRTELTTGLCYNIAVRGSSPADVRKYLKRVIDPNLVIPDLIAANAGLDRGPAKKRANIRLSGHALE